jgi:hypothetical protein
MNSCINFQHSFFYWRLLEEESIGRFTLDAVCRTKRLKTGFERDYYLLSGVMAGNVYAKDNLFKDPPYGFIAIFSEYEYKIFRNYDHYCSKHDSTGLVKERFKEINFSIQEQKSIKLIMIEDIIRYSINKSPLNAVISFDSGDDTRIEIEFPVRHINAQTEKQEFQVETGPIIIPSFEKDQKGDIDSFNIAYTAFNHLNESYFISLLPKGILKESESVTRVYSKIEKTESEIQIFAFQSLPEAG